MNEFLKTTCVSIYHLLLRGWNFSPALAKLVEFPTPISFTNYQRGFRIQILLSITLKWYIKSYNLYTSLFKIILVVVACGTIILK